VQLVDVILVKTRKNGKGGSQVPTHVVSRGVRGLLTYVPILDGIQTRRRKESAHNKDGHSWDSQGNTVIRYIYHNSAISGK
jgi:hypothetical protein